MSSSERATFAPTLPPPATMTYIRRPPRPAGARLAGAHRVDERRDRRLRRADGAQAELGVELCARPDRARERRRSRCRSAAAGSGRSTMFVLSPSVATTAASALSIPARSSTSVSIPCPTTKPPLQRAEPRQRLLVLVDGGHVPAVARRAASRRPSRPGRTRSRPPSDGRSVAPSPRRRPRGTRPRAPRTAHGGGRGRRSARRTATAVASAATSRARSGRRRGRGPRRRSRGRSSGRRSSA